MPSSTDKGKLLDELFANASTCEWLMGTFGHNAVLVFKTSALIRHEYEMNALSEQINTNKNDNNAIGSNKSAALNNDGAKKDRGCSDSMSWSSENSASSTSDDPTYLEADIAQAENYENIPQQQKTNRTNDANETNETNETNKTKENENIDYKWSINKQKRKNTIQKIIPKTQHQKSANENLSREKMPAWILNLTFRLTNTETKLLTHILCAHGFHETKDNKTFNLLWTGSHVKPDTLRSLRPHQRVNHFPRSYELTRKDRLYKNIEKMQHLHGLKNFDIVPPSFMLPLEFRSLKQAHRSGHRGPWIVKPAASSRGRGIYLVNTPDQIPEDDQVIVSKYIVNPLCIDDHKCDVRLYVAVTSFNPLIIYLYEEGLVRLATVKYDDKVENLWNPCIHLCNYSINKYHSDYIKATECDEDVGHKWTFSALLRHLKYQGIDTTNLMLEIEDLIIKSILACTHSITTACKMFVPKNQNNCFELFGFDILIENTLKPWLIEVNLSPSLGADTPLDVKVKSAMLTDLLTLVGIPANIPSGNDNVGTRFKTNPQSAPISARRPYLDSRFRTSNQLQLLSSEESRIWRHAQAQNGRCGGFVCIFPIPNSLERYKCYLNAETGIPMSTLGTSNLTATLPIHNLNRMLYTQLFRKKLKANPSLANESMFERMQKYQRPLHNINVEMIMQKKPLKSVVEANRLRKQLQKTMERGNDLTLLQVRKIFSMFLECILKRLTKEQGKIQHEKYVLKFITRSDISIKLPAFMKHAESRKVHAKDRTAFVAKMLGEYLSNFHRDTEMRVDNYSYYGLIPSDLFEDFLAQAHESDLEAILTLHVNLTHNLAFLYSRNSTIMPNAPPIPTGVNGFLKALPSMAPNIATRDLVQIDAYYRALSADQLEN